MTSTQVVWFAETWNMSKVRSAWPCLTKLAQRYIACFETLAQLALLQATHLHIGGSHCAFSLPSGTDNSATEAGINKLFSTSWPLQLLLQLVATWAHAHNVHLQPTCPDVSTTGQTTSAEDAFTVSRPADRVRFSPRSLEGGSLCAPSMRLGGQNAWLPR